MHETLKNAAVVIAGSEVVIGFTGAGITVESGIPDFRSKGNFWDGFDPDTFEREIDNREVFEKHPEKVWKFFSQALSVLEQAEPNDGHRAMAWLGRLARMAAPSILFFDEIDALVPRRGTDEGDSRVTERVISQFLTEMDGMEILGEIIILGATNREDLLDPALLRPGRFDMVLELGVPDIKARREILNIHNRKRRVSDDVDFDELARLTEGFVGSDIT